MKIARMSFVREGYPCKQDWPEDCFVQAGGDGIVFTKGTMKEAFTNPKKGIKALGALLKVKPQPAGSYRTAFFEAFLNDPDTFIRGEGKTVEEAEKAAWDKLQRYKSCKKHEFEKKGYKNGAGFCKYCNLFKSHAFKPEKGYE